MELSTLEIATDETTMEQIIEWNDERKSIVWDARPHRTDMEYVATDRTGWGQMYELTWHNPPELCLIGDFNRYFMINKREYLFNPQRLKKLILNHDETTVILVGRFISVDSVKKYLHDVEIGVRSYPPFRAGRHYDRITEQMRSHIHSKNFVEW